MERAQRQVLSPWLMLYFVVFSGSVYLLFGSFAYGELSEKSGNSPLYLGLLFGTYAVILYQLALIRDAAVRTAATSLAFLGFVGSGFVSLIAAGAPDISMLRFVLYVFTILTSLLIATRYNLDEFCESFFWASFGITLVHLLAYPLLAGRIVYDLLERETLLGITSYAGLFPHKSFAGTFFSLSMMISLVRFFGARTSGSRRSSMTLACLSAIALLMAGAVGRLLFLLITTIASLLIRAALRREVETLILMTGALVLGTIAYVVIGDDGWIYLLGRSPNLTGRTEVFSLWPRFFLERPLFGYGFDGFFTDVAGSPGSYLADLAEGRWFATFESDYLDLLIQFGLVGGIFFACILLSALGQAIRIYRSGTSKYKFVPVMFVMWSIIGASLDGGILIQNSLSCLIVFWIYFGVDGANRHPRRKYRASVQNRSRAFTGDHWRPRVPEQLR